uniref:Uncharacterized protein n=1 Tax=Arundo donax TaxID=35708 RepID=A0A0A9AHJ8_ARUDO
MTTVRSCIYTCVDVQTMRDHRGGFELLLHKIGSICLRDEDARVRDGS